MSDPDAPGAAEPGPGRAHETRDLGFHIVLFFGLGLALVVIVLVVLIRLLFGRGESPEPPEAPGSLPLRSVRLPPPDPRLETTPQEELRSLRKEEDERLGTYGWVDRKARIFRIPIEDAMDQVLRRGLPVRSLPKPPD
ncbi:MAG TPA: hypothetical protein VKW04_01265 [Planctomycetota bacterium]|nr:hypothetical protein [Planctomycetota bacterium]